MYKLVVTIDVRDFAELASFESAAVKIMAKYGGKIAAAYVVERHDNGRGREIHIVEFPDPDSYAKYRNDSRLSELADLRSQAIANIEVMTVLDESFYS